LALLKSFNIRTESSSRAILLPRSKLKNYVLFKDIKRENFTKSVLYLKDL